MQDYNKNNLMFLLCVFACLLAVYFTFVLLTLIDGGWWSTIVPIAFEIYGIYHLIKVGIKYKKASEIKK